MFQSLKSKELPTLLFLHGWGGKWQSWHPVLQILKEKYNVYAIDLPQSTNKILSLSDYSQFVLDFIKDQKLPKPILIGHSHGGAVATDIAARHPETISKLVLVDAASIRHPSTFAFKAVQTVLSPFKAILRPLVYRLPQFKNSDYAQLNTAAEKKTFQGLIHTDLTPLLPQINLPTLIIWGQNDVDTPVSQAHQIHSLINRSKLNILPGSHFAYLEHPPEFCDSVIKFIDET